MHSLLRRQLKRHFGDPSRIPPEWSGFLDLVDRAYGQFDDDRRMLERTLELSSQELLESSEEMRRAQEHKGQFLANMSHELRTPLNAILGYAELLAEDAVAPEHSPLRSDLEKIRTAAHHLLALINDVLDLAKIEAGRMPICVETVDLRAITLEAVVTVEPLAAKNGNRVLLDCPADAGTIRADPRRVHQVLLNLLSNAVKFTEHGTCTLAVRRVGEDVELRVIDDGIGMTEEQIGRIFLPFEQADASTTRRYGGTGLGLTICARLCEAMHARILVESKPGKGSTFTLRLPALAPEVAEAPVLVGEREAPSYATDPTDPGDPERKPA